MKIKIAYQLYADGDYSLRNREEFGCTGFETTVNGDEYFDYIGEMTFDNDDKYHCKSEAKTFLEKFLCDGLHVSYSHYWIIDDFYHAIEALIDFINDNDSGSYVKKLSENYSGTNFVIMFW